ncbi:RimJ/RimL family protein N-acetyltransferase [Kitasatospora sp. MAP12-15]|uniref:GNAT family N-acetyltransferase n=1 Tax=unclassified Kitasatospora TaxID=2633591 RepID=UPI00247304C0|nr:GNAT family protein [Kitasatospora sp. MAP12-44]MDH6112110.1 RimJ/RimL family protein N-acetyltransferase [Kitasatospora sp. MAP12-44]
MTAKQPVPVTLTGRHVRLEPLSRAHLADLFEAGGNQEEVWRWVPVVPPRTEQQLGELLDDLLAEVEGAESLPFAVVRLDTGRAVGWTSYLAINTANEWLEIGYTWYSPEVWRTAVNTEAKLLLLTHAFEELGMGRVMWKTDHRNERSQAAIRRLGAQYEGTHRRDRRRPDGSWRDSVYFSMLADEWPAAHQHLTARLAAG